MAPHGLHDERRGVAGSDPLIGKLEDQVDEYGVWVPLRYEAAWESSRYHLAQNVEELRARPLGGFSDAALQPLGDQSDRDEKRRHPGWHLTCEDAAT